MIRPDAHKYKFGDQGIVIVIVNDEEFEGVDYVQYSTDYRKNWCVFFSSLMTVFSLSEYLQFWSQAKSTSAFNYSRFDIPKVLATEARVKKQAMGSL
jgi:hypothetical protein